ncbi:MAG TPA: hypothetical protein PKC18_12340, partial [Lacipirellulaceae bacterium]|nr:hypothetical protein [Lacipirellulaceae bacterium]
MMNATTSTDDAVSSQSIRDEINRALDDLYLLSGGETPQRDFYEALLGRLCALTGASAGAVWLAAPGASVELLYSSGWPQLGRRRTRRLVQNEQERLPPLLNLPGAEWSNAGQGPRSYAATLSCPIRTVARPWGLATLYFTELPPRVSLAGHAQLVEAAVSLAERRHDARGPTPSDEQSLSG